MVSAERNVWQPFQPSSRPLDENPKDKKTNGKSMKKYIDDLANIKQATAENTHDETLPVDEIVRIGNA